MSNIIFKDETINRVVFHYNKSHNQDQSIPPWVIKHKGQTYYVNHLEIAPNVGFSTKETPDSEHTKASLLIRGKLTIVKENEEVIGYIN